MARAKATKKKLRIGVVGVGRGNSFAGGVASGQGMELVALCDTWEDKLTEMCTRYKGVTPYTDYDKFLEHDMDAVVLANYFHEHTPFAIKALKAGKHVMSETTACMTMAEGVQLVEAVEKSGLIYMFAENYPYMIYNQEMRKLYQEGKIGQFSYGEGEYVHPGTNDFVNQISQGKNHWRNWIPGTYYCTHALAPVMYITDTMPKKVNGFVMPYRDDDPRLQGTAIVSDAGSMIALHMDDESIVKLLGVCLRGHGNFVRIHGTHGMMENCRTGNQQMLRVCREQFHQKVTTPTEQIYLPNFPKGHEGATGTGHGGGDYFMCHHFATAIRTGEQPYLDVYRGVAMSAVAIQSYRSALDNSQTYDIPDFSKKSERNKFRKDHWNPDPTQHKKGDPHPSIKGKRTPSKKAMAVAKKQWKALGYEGE